MDRPEHRDERPERQDPHLGSRRKDRARQGVRGDEGRRHRLAPRDLGTCSYPLRAGHRPPIDERIPREHRLILRRTPLHGLDRERALEP